MQLRFLFVPALVIGFVACKDPAADKPKATVEAPKVETNAAAPVDPSKAPAPKAGETPSAPETLAFSNNGSTLAFTGSKVTGSHNGTFNTFSGTVTVAGDKVENITATIDVASAKTDQTKLDEHLKSKDFFDAQKYPKATFTSTEVRPGASGGATHTVVGNLDLHGVKKSISFPATVAVTPTNATAKAEFSINRKDFNIVYAGKPDDLIRDNVVIKLDINAPRTKK